MSRTSRPGGPGSSVRPEHRQNPGGARVHAILSAVRSHRATLQNHTCDYMQPNRKSQDAGVCVCVCASQGKELCVIILFKLGMFV